jgi:heterodisulfide reductase subunit C
MKAMGEITKIDLSFAKEAMSTSGVDLFACYQCQKCTNGCPVAFTMDYGPHEMIRMLQLGLTEEIGQANTVWVCASCETCFTRCPQQIDIPALMDHLKQCLLRRGDKPTESAVVAFHQAFLENVRRFGRVNETVLMAEFQLKSLATGKAFDPKEALHNLKLGMSMFRKGRLGVVPKRTGGKEAVRKLFKDSPLQATGNVLPDGRASQHSKELD